MNQIKITDAQRRRSKADTASMEALSSCSLCPRNCQADRLRGHTGSCGQTAQIRVARAALHQWEEPCLSGNRGSGTVFFSGCPLGCIYCQNREIAQGKSGKIVTVEKLSDIFLNLQESGAHNINLVTPTHFVPQIIRSLELAGSRGLRLPVVYNTGSYECVETIRMLDGYVDIYLPDLKYQSPQLAEAYSHAPDYFQTACGAIAEMIRQVGMPVMEEQEDLVLMKKGVLIRHLILPGATEDSKRILDYLIHTYGECTAVSLMSQYTPLFWSEHYPNLNRKLTKREYEKVMDYALSLGLQEGYFQEGAAASESFLPAFDGEGIE